MVRFDESLNAFHATSARCTVSTSLQTRHLSFRSTQHQGEYKNIRSSEMPMNILAGSTAISFSQIKKPRSPVAKEGTPPELVVRLGARSVRSLEGALSSYVSRRLRPVQPPELPPPPPPPPAQGCKDFVAASGTCYCRGLSQSSRWKSRTFTRGCAASEK